MDMDTTDELRHILLGLRAGEKPRGFGIAGYRVTCRRDSYEVLESVKEALTFILTVKIGIESGLAQDEGRTDAERVGLILEETVIKQLSEWYRHRFNLQGTENGADYVSGFGRGRDWSWWEARIRSDNDFLLLLEVSGWPCSGLTALRSLLEKCGAESMEEIPEQEW